MEHKEFLSFVQTASSVTVYTDGSCMGNPGPGGWGACFVFDDHKTYSLSGGEPQTTNNRMEMTAALEALRAMPENVLINLYTDSQYLKNGITVWMPAWIKRQWKTSKGGDVKNQDLWNALHIEVSKRSIIWQWVKAHNGNEFNEKADALAKQAVVAVHMRTER